MTSEFDTMFSLTGRTCVITGAGGELCGAMARCLGALGVKVALLDINPEAARSKAEQISTAGGAAFAATCDVLDRQQLSACCERVLNQWGSIDLLVVGAGGNDPQGSTADEFLDPGQPGGQGADNLFSLDPDGFSRVFALNFLGSFLTIQVFAQQMVKQGRGSIVTISSMSASTPLTKVPAYSAAKAALSNFTRWLSVYLSRTGVRVNAIAPGFFMTEQLRFLHVDQQTGALSERARKVIASTPLGRYGEPEDLFGTLIWLLSDGSKFVTGAVVPVDGGFSSYSI